MLLVVVVVMSREAVELQLVNYYAREGYYYHLQVLQHTHSHTLALALARTRRCTAAGVA